MNTKNEAIKKAEIKLIIKWYTIFFSNESQLVFKKEELDFQVDKQLILEF